jgi:hypothetical protein
MRKSVQTVRSGLSPEAVWIHEMLLDLSRFSAANDLVELAIATKNAARVVWSEVDPRDCLLFELFSENSFSFEPANEDYSQNP